MDLLKVDQLLCNYLNLVMDMWTELLESGGQIDVVYTDLEKAFDKVPHKRLISKLYSYKINPKVIKWIEAFLTNKELELMAFFPYGRKF